MGFAKILASSVLLVKGFSGLDLEPRGLDAGSGMFLYIL